MILPKILQTRYLLKSQDAVAEIMDFVTISGILLISFSIIGVAGYPILKNAQETRYTENTKMSFIVLADNINKIALGQAPSQSVELKIYGGRLSVTMDSTIKINVTRFNITKLANEEITVFNDQVSMGNIQNSIGDTVVAYEGTGVWVKYPSGTILNVYKPLVINQSNMIIIPVVRIIGNSSIGGNGINRIRANGEPSSTLYSNVSNITVTITGDYVSGWKNYFININKINWETDDTYTARLNTTKNLDVYILSTDMYTEIE